MTWRIQGEFRTGSVGNGRASVSLQDACVARIAGRPTRYVAVGINAGRYFADSTRYGADVNLETPWIILRGEYVGQHHDEVTNDDDKGWFALAAVPLRPWAQPLFKYERFNRPRVPLEASKNRAWTAGVNFYPWGRATRMTLEYISRTIGEPGVRKSTALAQAQLIF